MNEIRKHYLNLGHSRRSYAEFLGIHENALRRLEKGLNVHPATAKKVADDMGVLVTDLLSHDGASA